VNAPGELLGGAALGEFAPGGAGLAGAELGAFRLADANWIALVNSPEGRA
jgi:hypothetical protein